MVKLEISAKANDEPRMDTNEQVYNNDKTSLNGEAFRKRLWGCESGRESKAILKGGCGHGNRRSGGVVCLQRVGQ